MQAVKPSKLRGILRRVRTACLVLALLIAVAAWCVGCAVKPVLLSLGQAQAQSLAAGAMNAALREAVGSVAYDDLVEVRTDGNGRITMLQMNTGLMNRIAATAADDAQQRIDREGRQEITVPILAALGSRLFGDWGPVSRTGMTATGAVSAAYESEFAAAGINQTRHRVYLCLSASVSVAMYNESHSLQATARAPIAESIIVGEVPQSLTEAGGASGTLELLPGGR